MGGFGTFGVKQWLVSEIESIFRATMGRRVRVRVEKGGLMRLFIELRWGILRAVGAPLGGNKRVKKRAGRGFGRGVQERGCVCVGWSSKNGGVMGKIKELRYVGFWRACKNVDNKQGREMGCESGWTRCAGQNEE